MLISFRCRRCRSALSAALSQAGVPYICPVCKGEMIVPSASEKDVPATGARPAACPPPAALVAAPAPACAAQLPVREPVPAPSAPPTAAIVAAPAPACAPQPSIPAALPVPAPPAVKLAVPP